MLELNPSHAITFICKKTDREINSCLEIINNSTNNLAFKVVCTYHYITDLLD